MEVWGNARRGDRVPIFPGDFVKDRQTRPSRSSGDVFFPRPPRRPHGAGVAGGVTAGEGGGVAVVFSSSSTAGRGRGPAPQVSVVWLFPSFSHFLRA